MKTPICCLIVFSAVCSFAVSQPSNQLILPVNPPIPVPGQFNENVADEERGIRIFGAMISEREEELRKALEDGLQEDDPHVLVLRARLDVTRQKAEQVSRNVDLFVQQQERIVQRLMERVNKLNEEKAINETKANYENARLRERIAQLEAELEKRNE